MHALTRQQWNEFLFYTFLLLLCSAFFVWNLLCIIRNERRRRSRGFEVKTSTGETPVLLKERENDHG